MRADTLERVRAIMAKAAANPGTPVAIPANLAAEVSAYLNAQTREAILEIRRREWRYGDPLPPFGSAGVPLLDGKTFPQQPPMPQSDRMDGQGEQR
jgi:hypothetical protein